MNFFYITLFILNINAFAQIPKTLLNSPSGYKLDNKSFEKMEINDSNLEGVYVFGESESESNLFIMYFKKSLILQLHFHEFVEDTLGNIKGINKFINFNKANYNIDSFCFSKYFGVLTRYNGEDYIYKKAIIINGLPISNKKYNKDTGEIGFYISTIDNYYLDYEYPEIFINELDSTYFKKINNETLNYMKNLIYAKYGYIFKNKKIRMIFESKEWYNPCNEKVDQNFTEIEKTNLNLILKYLKS